MAVQLGDPARIVDVLWASAERARALAETSLKLTSPVSELGVS